MLRELPGSDDSTVGAFADLIRGDELIVRPFVGAVLGPGFEAVLGGSAVGAAILAVAELVGGEFLFLGTGEVVCKGDVESAVFFKGDRFCCGQVSEQDFMASGGCVIQ